MNTTLKLSTRVMAMCVAVLFLSAPLFAQETDATQKAEAEMEAAFGTVPVMFEVYPDHLRAGAWNWFASTLSPETTLPPKVNELISLAVASQIPCSYCVYAHTSMAKMFGATDAEIQAAVASAAGTRHWSTVLNGANVPFEDFKKEWDGILAHIKKQNEAK